MVLPVRLAVADEPAVADLGDLDGFLGTPPSETLSCATTPSWVGAPAPSRWMPRPTSLRWCVASWTAWRTIQAASTTSPPRAPCAPQRGSSRPSSAGRLVVQPLRVGGEPVEGGVERLGRRVGHRAARPARSRSSTVRTAWSSRPMWPTTSALWPGTRRPTTPPAPGAWSSTSARRPRWSAPTSAPAPAACRACPAGRTARRRTDRPRRSRRRHRHRVRPRSSWSWSWRVARAGHGLVDPGSGTTRSVRRPASSASDTTSRSGSPVRRATRAASSCSTLTRPGLTFTRTG